MVELKPGQLVRSLAGRDKGKHYLVLREIDERYALLVDGRTRPLAKPKKKNKVHLQRYGRTAALEDTIAAGRLENSQVIRLLKEMASPAAAPDKEV